MITKNSLLPIIVACVVPIYYLIFYTPYGMDTTDFGYFYAYAWRILQGQTPYVDFYYNKPALPLYWHAFWLSLSPSNWEILCGKAGFLLSMLASSWFASLFLNKVFNLKKLNLPLPLLATTGFVFSIHSFPHMPWHTADGVLFCAAALWTAIINQPIIAGILTACAMLCKQSFLLVPFAITIMLYFYFPRKKPCVFFIISVLCSLAAAYSFLILTGSHENFRTMTTGQLDIKEAIQAGILIYLNQNWLYPLLALAPFICFKLCKKSTPPLLQPCPIYMLIIAIIYVYQALSSKTWIGYGFSWPTLFMVLGGICIFLPKIFLHPWQKTVSIKYPFLTASICLGCALIVSWSTAISGGYKIPAFFSTPMIFSFCLMHVSMNANAHKLIWLTLVCGLIMFRSDFEYPYVFPNRQIARSEMNFDAGQIYPQAQGVKIDKYMYEKLIELKELRTKYGANYKTLPGFSFAYYLNRDKPIYPSDWLIDWEINGEIDKMYQELLDKNITVFMERDQMDTKKADAYARSGYGVPQKVRSSWRIVEETPHFVVFQPPNNP